MATRPTRKITDRKPETPCQDHPAYDATNCPQCGTAAAVPAPAAKAARTRKPAPAKPEAPLDTTFSEMKAAEAKPAAKPEKPAVVQQADETKKQNHGRLPASLREITVKADDDEVTRRIRVLIEQGAAEPSAVCHAMYWHSGGFETRVSASIDRIKKLWDAAQAPAKPATRTARTSKAVTK